jgi:molybdopterin-synthase adenylyltransferase
MAADVLQLASLALASALALAGVILPTTRAQFGMTMAMQHMSLERYDRQMRMAELGAEGQAKLRASRVLVIGAGGLGSPAILYLAAAGVGTLSIVDGDVVALSNLNRQILHRTSDVGSDKVQSAGRAVRELNPEVSTVLVRERVDARRIAELAGEHDLVVDASDSFASKYAINEGALRSGKPFLHAGVEGLMGQLGLLGLDHGPCLRCIFPDAPEEPTTPRPILGATAGVLGSILAAEAIKHLAGCTPSSSGKLLLVNLRTLRFHTIEVERDPDCPACSGH